MDDFTLEELIEIRKDLIKERDNCTNESQLLSSEFNLVLIDNQIKELQNG